MGLISKTKVSVKKALVSAYHLGWLAIGKIRVRLPNIRNSWNGDRFGQPHTKHAVFVHYDQAGQIHGFVVQWLNALVECGYTITFVSNSPKLPQSSIAILKPLTRLIIHRFNSGYDFAAYRDGIRSIDNLDDAESLILMNDSAYGPLYPLAQQLEKVTPEDCDVWGITDSWEFRYHVQGYFMLFFSSAIRSKAFKKFWRKFPNVSNKRWVIMNGEVKLTSKLAQEKLRVRVMCPYWEVVEDVMPRLRKFLAQSDTSPYAQQQQSYLVELEGKLVAGIPVNQSHFLWEHLIRERGCPILKRELIVKNPEGIPYAWRWKTVLSECTDFDTDLIDAHLHSL